MTQEQMIIRFMRDMIYRYGIKGAELKYHNSLLESKKDLAWISGQMSKVRERLGIANKQVELEKRFKGIWSSMKSLRLLLNESYNEDLSKEYYELGEELEKTFSKFSSLDYEMSFEELQNE